jgi:hypothetical protein
VTQGGAPSVVGLVLPPQSTPVSLSFFTPSWSVGAWQVPPLHTLLWQSLATLQVSPLGHGLQVGPPQSTSVSSPSFTPSLHVGATHFPIWQVAL